MSPNLYPHHNLLEFGKTYYKDAGIIENYKNPAYVLGGWKPEMAPRILKQPESAAAGKGQTVVLRITAAAVPEASYQWLKNGTPIKGATASALTLERVTTDDTGTYAARVKNDAGSAMSNGASLTINR